MKRLIVVCALFLTIGTSVILAQEVNVNLEATIIPGSQWMSRMWYGIIPVKKTPQCAFWIETEEGEYVTTLTVTSRTASQQWRGNPDGGRPDSLPVWLHAAKSKGGSIDAVSSATPENSPAVTNGSNLLQANKVYVARFEVNTSFDYNDTWPKKARQGESNWSGVNGQPSLIYEAKFRADEKGSIELKAVGTGSIDGSDGNIQKSLTGLDSALLLVEKVTLSIQ